MKKLLLTFSLLSLLLSGCADLSEEELNKKIWDGPHEVETYNNDVLEVVSIEKIHPTGLFWLVLKSQKGGVLGVLSGPGHGLEIGQTTSVNRMRFFSTYTRPDFMYTIKNEEGED